MRTLTFTFNWPSLVEAVALEPDDDREAIESEGYRDSGVDDLLIDIDPASGRPYCFMSANFDQNYLSVIWGLKRRVPDEEFNVPQANLQAVPLHVAFSWAYYHFILEDGQRLATRDVIRIDPNNLTQVVLAHAAQTAA